MSAYDGYSTYGRMYGMAYPPASPTSHYHVAGLQSAAAAAANSAAGGTGSIPTPKAYNGLCLTGSGVDLLHPAMVYPGIAYSRLNTNFASCSSINTGIISVDLNGIMLSGTHFLEH